MGNVYAAGACAVVISLGIVAGVGAQDTGSSKGQTATAAPPKVSDTDKALKAKRVSTRVAIHLDAAAKEIRYALDEENNSIGHKLSGSLFSTSSDVMVTYPLMNPLAVQAKADVSEAEDPTHAAMAQLIAAIAGVPGLINPDLAKAGAALAPRAGVTPGGAGAAAQSCDELIEAQTVLERIQVALFGETVAAKNLADQFKQWVATFDRSVRQNGGPAAATETAAAIDAFFKIVHASTEDAAQAIKLAQERARGPLTPTKAQVAYERFLADLLSGKDQAAQVKALADRKADLDLLRSRAADSLPCAQDALNLYRVITIATPQVRLAEVQKLEKALADLRDVLRTTYGPANNWYNNTEFVIAKDIEVPAGRLAHVVVKAITIKVEPQEATLGLTPQEAATATFDVREYTRFVPELGIGATFAVLDRPKYGTTTVDGKLVVSKAGTQEVSFSPTVMVNFVPVGVGGSAPIVQVGASTSTSAPAVFLGGGWRIPGSSGKSGIVVGVGFVLGWVKDLDDTLVPDKTVVSGTKDIEEHLKFKAKPKPGFYLNIQYKF